MKCIVCDKEISKERLKQKRRILTCGKICSNKYATTSSYKRLQIFREKKERAKQEEVI